MKKIFLLLLLLPILAMAEQTPDRGTFDPRVRVVDYNPMNVVRLATFYGVSTHVQFGKHETIVDVAVGDDLAWTISSRGNNLFIKPKATNADTNVTVITEAGGQKRVYQFALVVEPRPTKDSTAWRDPNLIFSLSFRYPDEEAAKLAAQEKAAGLKSKLDQMKTRLSDAKKECRNPDYWVAGAQEVSPTGACDDGRFIYLTFSNNRDMPAVYATDPEGNEALVNTNVDGNVIVVQRLLRHLTLRKGPAVACVVNKAFELDGGTDNTTGTISPDVTRVIKGAKQ